MTKVNLNPVNGTLTLKSGKARDFCEVYEFSNAKGTSVQEITSYVIEMVNHAN